MISRASDLLTFPANFVLIEAMNPCPLARARSALGGIPSPLRRDSGRDRSRGRCRKRLDGGPMGKRRQHPGRHPVGAPDAPARGRLSRELRETLIAGDGIPSHWNEAARWYRRTSGRQSSREMIGAAIAASLDDLRGIESPPSLRRHYGARDGDCVRSILDHCGFSEEHLTDLRRVEDAAYSLR